MNVEWALHHICVWSPGWWRDEYWYLPFLLAQTDPGETDMTFTPFFFCWFRSRILGLFDKHHNDINEIKEWSIDIAGLHNCCRFSGRDSSLRVTLPLVCIVYWVVALLSFLLLSKQKAYSWLKWKLKAELSAASTITRNIKVQQTITKERISCPWLLLGRHKSQHQSSSLNWFQNIYSLGTQNTQIYFHCHFQSNRYDNFFLEMKTSMTCFTNLRCCKNPCLWMWNPEWRWSIEALISTFTS